MWRHLAAEAGMSKIRGVQGYTISLQAVVHPRHMPWALMEKKKKKVLYPILDISVVMGSL
jgi:hypothetical protein